MPKEGRGRGRQLASGSGASSASGSRAAILCSFVCAIAAVVAGWYAYGGWTAGRQQVLAPPTSPVPKETIGGRTYRELAELRRPVVVTDTVADRWPARTAFTTSFLARKLSHVLAYQQTSKRSFITFHDNKPLEPLVNERWEDFNVKVNTTIPELLQWGDHGRDPLRGPYQYFSQDIATLREQFPDVIDYVQPINDLILSDDNVQVNLWIGRQGIITHTHYDCTYNFFVQLQGRKRFSLFPPNASLYLYPCLHPHYGHSQVDILQPDLEEFPMFPGATPLTAELSPGDMLVVPPFWFHHVETVAESVSLNVWSDAPEYALINEIYARPIPFESDWGWLELLKATRIYTDMILVSLGTDDVQRFLQLLLTQRYDPVVRTGNLNVNQSLVDELSALCHDVDWSRAKEIYEPLFQGGVAQLKVLFTQIPSRPVRDVCIGNYIEHLIHRAVGLDYVYGFLLSCVT